MKVAIIGSRKIGTLTVEKIIDNIPNDCTLIISGGAIGVDTLANQAALALDIPIKEYLPDYDVFGKTAPIIRNHKIIDECDAVIAFWDYKSKGTQNALIECLRQDKPLKIIIIDDSKYVGTDK